jgi:ribonuclease HI
VASVVGTIVSILPAFKYGKLHYRDLEKCKINRLRSWWGDFSKPCYISDEGVSNILYWLRNCAVENGTSLVPFQSEVELFTDSSLTMWGAVCNGSYIGEEWTVSEYQGSDSNINVLEMMAVCKALKRLSGVLRGKSVTLRCDNATAVYYINSQGGHKSVKCDLEAKRIWTICLNLDIDMVAVHIAGKENTYADCMSRLDANTEWTLRDDVFRLITSVFGEPDIDLCASGSNTKCNNYVSWEPDKEACCIDAFSFKWKSEVTYYAFPPFSLVGKVIQKADMDGCKMILVYPDWEAQAWYPRLKGMLKGEELSLPDNPLTMDHPLGRALKLKCGRI